MILIRIVAILQALCLLPILIRFLLLPPDFDAVGLWFFSAGVAAVTFPYGLWQFFRHPSRRPWAGVMILLALGTVGTPMVMAEFDLEPVPLSVASVTAVLMAVILTIFLFARPGLWRPDGGLASGTVNRVLLGLLVVAVVLTSVPLVAGLIVGFPPPLADHRDGLKLGHLILHAASVGAVSLVLAVFSLLFAAVGLWRAPNGRVLHLLQLLTAVLLLGLLAVEGLLLSILMVNSG